MSTHSTHLSEVAEIEKVNVMKKLPQRAIVMKPTNGLSSFGETQFNNKNFITSLTRYLDAKRNVLLFSKGILLVEGDGEEILIPALVKSVIGVSLDELGIGLINVGSVAFENIACIFDELRLQRQCAIITDFDVVVDGTDKSKPKAEKLGESRKAKLDNLFSNNPYVEVFYAPHTLEIDFANNDRNRLFIQRIINAVYKHKSKKDELAEALYSADETERYNVIISISQHIKKGWYATLLAAEVNNTAIIPKYILEALAFASKDVIDEQVIRKIVKYSCSRYDDIEDIKEQVENADTREKMIACISEFRRVLPDDMASIFLEMAEVK
jgi:predicted ATP-dependent endonuclease of OLD family